MNDLRALLDDVCSTSASTEYAVLAKEVIDQIPDEDRDDALLEALMLLMPKFVTRARRHTRVDSDAVAAEQVTPIRRSARSAKVAGIREYWRVALRERYAVDLDGDGTKRLADCTRADMVFMIRVRDTAARRTAAKALEFRGLLDLMVRHDVGTVGELPEAVLAAVLVRAA